MQAIMIDGLKGDFPFNVGGHGVAGVLVGIDEGEGAAKCDFRCQIAVDSVSRLFIE